MTDHPVHIQYIASPHIEQLVQCKYITVYLLYISCVVPLMVVMLPRLTYATTVKCSKSTHPYALSYSQHR